MLISQAGAAYYGAMKLKNKSKIGLVLSGGGIKAAAFHIGVCLALFIIPGGIGLNQPKKKADLELRMQMVWQTWF